MEDIVFDPQLTGADVVLLRNLADDIARRRGAKSAADGPVDEGYASRASPVQEQTDEASM
jgi:hypothetical protein